MQTKGAKKVGRFSIQFEVANDKDLMRAEEGIISPDQIRRMTIEGVVDPGGDALLFQPRLQRLPLPPADDKQVPNRFGARVRDGQDRIAAAQRLQVVPRVPAPGGSPSVQVPQLDS